MEYSMQKLDKSVVEFAVNVEKEEWDNCIFEAYKKNKHNYKIEGFRPGKVPFSVIEKRYGKEAFFEDATDYALNKYYGEILDGEKDLEPVARPEVDIKEVSVDGLKFVITVAVMPTFDMPAYTGLTVEKPVTEVKDEEVDAEVAKRQEQACRWLDITDRAVENGDRVIIDFSGSVDGVKFEGGTAENYTLDIGSNSFIPGFEAQIEGMKLDEAKDITVKFPEEYGSKELAGKEAVFAIKLHEIKKKELPALDDEFAKDVSEFDTLAEYKQSIKDKMLKDAEQKAEYEVENKLIDAISAGATIELPDAMIAEELDRMMEELKMRLSYSGLKFEDYLKYAGTTEEAIREERKADAEKTVKSRLVIEGIIKAEKINVEKEEVEAEIQKASEAQGIEVEEFKKKIDSNAMSRLFNKIISDKLFAFLRANNTVA